MDDDYTTVPQSSVSDATKMPQELSQTPNTPNAQNTSNMTHSEMISSFVIAGLILAFNLILLYTTFKKTNPNAPSFSFYEILKQSTLLYITAHVIGFSGLIHIFRPFKRYNYMIIPIALALVTYIMNVGMGYTQFSSCDSKNDNKKIGKKWMIFAVSLLPALLVFLIGYTVSSLKFMKQPFYEILGGTESDIGFYMAVGFWSACIIWPSVSFVYFILEQHKCQDVNKIELKDMSKVLNDA